MDPNPPTLTSVVAAIAACDMSRPAPDVEARRAAGAIESLSTTGAVPRSRTAAAGPSGRPTEGDRAVRELHLSLDGRGSLIPPAYLEPLRRNGHLDRGPAALLFDTAARACADARSIGTRLAVITAHRLCERRAYQRLGYRTPGDYAREELGITPRAFRDMARLGGRLEILPATRQAFLDGEITRTQAEVIAGIATNEDELRWLAQARSSTVRALKAAAREARDRAGSLEAEPSGHPADEDEPRRRRAFDIPSEMLGKIDAALELAALVAGTRMPAGATWEMIAAEYLSGMPAKETTGAPAGDETRMPTGETTRIPPGKATGAPAGETDGVPAAEPSGESGTELARGRVPGSLRAESRTSTTIAEATANAPSAPTATSPHQPEDPNGLQEWLERESRNWCYLPSARPSLELHGDWKLLRNRCTDDRPRSAWGLHRDMTSALAAERRVAWELGRLLVPIRNRRLWRSMMFASFAHYLRERLGISVRAAGRLIRIDREAWSYPALQRAYQAGELSPLVAETLLRVLRHTGPDQEAQQAWIDYAKVTTFQRLCEVVRAAERFHEAPGPGGRRPLGSPGQVERRIAVESETAGECATQGPGSNEGRAVSPMFVTSEVASRPGWHATSGATRSTTDSPMFVTSEIASQPGWQATSGVMQSTTGPPMFVTTRYAVWMTAGESEILDRGLAAVGDQLARHSPDDGPARKIPTWARLDALIEHFVREYDGQRAERMREKHPLFERDDWRCRAPGCSAYGPLHLHHIVFRSHGGGDEPENLVTLCDFHHKALHDGWIRCAGRAPDALYWELGVDRSEGLAEAPVARLAGHRRLTDDEYWDGRRVRRMEALPSDRRRRAPRFRPGVAPSPDDELDEAPESPCEPRRPGAVLRDGRPRRRAGMRRALGASTRRVVSGQGSGRASGR